MDNIITKKCNKCGVEKPTTDFSTHSGCKDGLRPHCKKCRSSETKLWTENNREVISEKRKRHWNEHKDEISIKRKKHYAENADEICKRLKEKYPKFRDKIIKRAKEWYLKNKEYKSAYDFDYREKNKDKLRLGRKNYYQENSERFSKRNKTWRETHPEEARAYHRNRKALIKKCNGKISCKEWKELLEKYGSACLKCGSTENIEMDHVTPIALGGEHNINNVQPLCKKCNRDKWATTADYRPKD